MQGSKYIIVLWAILLAVLLVGCESGTVVNENFLLFHCMNDSSCLAPPQCPNTAGTCQNNQCVYTAPDCSDSQIRNYLLTIKTISLNEPVVNEIGNVQEVSFIIPETIAGKEFTARALTPLKEECPVARGDHLSMLQTACYEIRPIWADTSAVVKNYIPENLTDFIEVKYTPTGRGVFNGVKNDVNYDYEFVDTDDKVNQFLVTLKDAIEVTNLNYAKIVLMNSENKATITLKNNIFDLNTSGFKVRVSRRLRDIFDPSVEIEQEFLKGERMYEIDLPTDEFGEFDVEITPFFDIMGPTEYIGQQIILNYFVTTDESLVTQETNFVVRDTITCWSKSPSGCSSYLATECLEDDFPDKKICEDTPQPFSTTPILIMIGILLLFILVFGRRNGR